MTSEALDQIRTRFFEVAEYGSSLDEDARDRLLKRWEAELADYISAFIGRSFTEWVNRSDEVILFDRLAENDTSRIENSAEVMAYLCMHRIIRIVAILTVPKSRLAVGFHELSTSVASFEFC